VSSIISALRGSAPTADTVFVRTGAPPVDFAGWLARLPGTELARAADLSVVLRRVTIDGQQYRILVSPGRPDEHSNDDGSLTAGYDTVLRVEIEGATAKVVEAETNRLFLDIRDSVAAPALLAAGRGTALAVWSPQQGLHRFDEPVSVRSDARQQWQDLALPPAEPGPATSADDLPTQLVQQAVRWPTDDAVRLALAATFRQWHPEYAELISLQVEHCRRRRARLPLDIDQVHRERDLVLQLHDAVGEPVRALGAIDWRIGRGLVESVTVPAAYFLDHSQELFAAAPIRHVRITVVGEHLAGLTADPALGRLQGLSLRDSSIGDQGAEMIAASSKLARLRLLDLRGTGITAAGVEAIAASGNLPALRYLACDPEVDVNPRRATGPDGHTIVLVPSALGHDLAGRYDRAWLRYQPSLDPARGSQVPTVDEL
jgi:hypothetical protein